ncbi:MAG: hypothetical protein K2P31_02125, partial [Rickettsiaceae bacterium]|nr:hypothetical protein [Rickettsiaceae bacterium]
SGSSIQSMEEIDSKPSDLIKLASFYYEAVKISVDDLKKLLRKGRGNTGGKTTIFERLFKYANLCGYRFKNKPDYIIEVTDKKRFSSYVKSVVAYLTKKPLTTYREVDDKDEAFFKAIGISTTTPNSSRTPSGNPPPSAPPTPTPKGSTPPPAPAQPKHKNKAQLKPQYNRTIPGTLKKIIDECYDLNEQNFTNAKIAMSRVVFECCLKYIIEETKHNNIFLKDKPYFSSAFPANKYTNFTTLKSLFQDLVKNNGKKQAFKSFDLEMPHQIIHNYNIAGLVKDARTLGGNLIPLIEFMLDTEANLLGSLDNTKL